MNTIIKYPKKKKWKKLVQRPYFDLSGIDKTVRTILKKIKTGGDQFLFKYTKKFDGIKLKSLLVTGNKIETAEKFLSPELKKAIDQAKLNIEKFHLPQLEEIKIIETMPGIKCWRSSVGIEKVGLYIPGGTAPLFSTVLMLAIPAQIAGCKEIIICTPPQKDGSIHPAILYAARICGIKNIFKVGGAQAIAAMAYGTESIPKVFKIFGPGNQYVTLAKQLVQQEGIAIDMPAGPSELLIIADDSSVPEFVAADLLSQAEHGTDSHVILITTEENIALKVQEYLKEQIKELPRKAIAKAALANSKIILSKNLDEAIEFSNLYAPEHLILSIREAEKYIPDIISAGSVFIGNYAPESAGDYASGTNHTLPTNGYAAMYSGVSVDSFVKKISYQVITKQGLENIGPTVMEMASTEGLDAHKNAVAIRLK